VLRLTDEIALVQSVDFFTPIVDDPYLFGQIAAANAFSDVYAMGGTPRTAMNLVAFPIKKLNISVLQETLRGGLDKIHEAGAVLVGGHSIDDAEFKYGLSVAGTVHPGRVLKNRGACPGDRLVLSKPLGTGILATAIKAGLAGTAASESILASMVRLNRRAAELLESFSPHACTDVTGFGLLGHALEMIEGSEVGLVIDHTALPIFPQTVDFAEQGIMPGGLHRNRKYREASVDLDTNIPRQMIDVLYDPQTSGGLLVALAPSEAQRYLEELHTAGEENAALIGEFVEQPAGRVIVR